MQQLFSTKDDSNVNWESESTFKTINELFKETGGCDTALDRIDTKLVGGMRLKNINEKMSENEITNIIKSVVTTFYNAKSQLDQLNDFFSACIIGVLPNENWDADIHDLHKTLNMTKQSFLNDLSSILVKSSLQLGNKYQEFVNSINHDSKSETFKQLWKDVVSNQMNKYGPNSPNGIKVKAMDCVDVCLFLRSLTDVETAANETDNTVDIEKSVFERNIDGTALFKQENINIIKVLQPISVLTIVF